ncbi:MAG: hypothetical protein L0387_40715 [Acidobacteria bacterium]|nr:hypothetical protein [Acidobacteriota bacterium]
MVTKERWKEAQTYEKSYWQNAASQIASGSQSQLEWYAWKAKMMEQRLEGSWASLHAFTVKSIRNVLTAWLYD